jgi:hypothetical protein
MHPARRRLRDANRDALLLELNRRVEEAAESVAGAVASGAASQGGYLVYPPNAGLTADEAAALEQLRAVPHAEAALRKVLAHAAALPLHDLLALIDGVGDPQQGEWSGVSLLDKVDEEDEEDEFLHDGFFGAYWRWRAVRPDKGWTLDALDGPGPGGR